MIQLPVKDTLFKLKWLEWVREQYGLLGYTIFGLSSDEIQLALIRYLMESTKL